MRWPSSIAVLLSLMLAAAASANDDVQELRDNVDRPWSPTTASESPPKRQEDSPRRNRGNGYCDDDCNDDDEGVSGELLGVAAVVTGAIVTTPIWVPATLVDDGQQRTGWFTQYPYQFHDSYMTFSSPTDEPWEPSRWSLRAESDFGTNFNSQQLFGGHVLWEHQYRWGLETRFARLEDEFQSVTDSLWFGDLNGTYRFAQSEHWLFRGGLGMNWLSDHGDESYGVNGTYQIDWFPSEPFVFSTDLDVGTLGDAWLFHFQQTAGVTWHGIEARVGYDYLDVGNAQFSMFLCGVRGWF
jgi:hypothetical protein